MTTTPNQSLVNAVRELANPSRMRREYGDVRHGKQIKIVENLTGPSLLEELIDAIEPNNNVSTGGSFGSRPTIDPAALDLWVAISYDVNYWAEELKIDRTKYSALGKPGVPQMLRAVSVTTAKGSWKEPQMEATADICWAWSRRIRGMLHDNKTWRELHGASCPDCGMVWLTKVSGDGKYVEHRREPAMVVQFNPETSIIRYWLCRACKKLTWRNEVAA